MTVRDLLQQLNALPNHDAEVLVQVPDPDNPEAPDDYTIESVDFMDWPEHYESMGDVSGVGKSYIKV
jgi:hypothetical protein